MSLALVGLSLFNYQDDARSNKHQIHNGFCIPFKSFANTPGPQKMRQSMIRYFTTFIDSSGGHSERLFSTVTFVNNQNSTVTKSGTYINLVCQF